MDEQADGYDAPTRGAVHDAEYDWADHQVDYQRLHELAAEAHLLEGDE